MAATAALMVAAAGAPAERAAAVGKTTSRPGRHDAIYASRAELFIPSAWHAKTDPANSQAVGSTPPLGGCTWISEATVSATYVHHVLTGTRSDYSGNVECKTTAPGQTMEELALMISVSRNFNAQKITFPAAQCFNNYSTDPPCLALQQADTSFCAVFIANSCDGVYRAASEITLLLPTGWYYSTTPKNCVSLGGGQELVCTVQTEPPAEIPPMR